MADNFAIGSLTELMGDLEGAMNAYEQALRHNQWSIPAMNAISCILRTKEQFAKAVEYLQNILKLDPTSGETWGSLGKTYSHWCAALGNQLTMAAGHCHLMMDNLQDAYTSYQQALYHLRDPKVGICSVTCRRRVTLTAAVLCRSRNSGMELVYSTTATVLSTMPRRLSPRLCVWPRTLKKPTKSTFAWA